MEKTVASSHGAVTYTYKVSTRAKRMRIVVYPGGSITVTVPASMKENLVEKFLLEKSDWMFHKRRAQALFDPVEKKSTKEEYLMHKERALKLVNEKVIHFAEVYGFSYGKVTIKNHKTLWGSCSKRGNLNFNYKLALLPERLLEYVVVHELCHLKEFNHGKGFWGLVAKTIPDHKACRLELKRIGRVF